MDRIFFFQQLMNLTHIDIWICHPEDHTKILAGSADRPKPLQPEEEERFSHILCIEGKDYPTIFLMGRELVGVRICVQENEWILAGPVILGPVEEKYYLSLRNKYRELLQWGFQLRICRLQTLVTEVLLLYWMTTGRRMTEEEFWEQNDEQFEKVRMMEPTLYRDIFYESENSSFHNPYEQERRELNSITDGDIDALKKSMDDVYEGEIGILAKDPLRHHKNVAIGNITLASRAAILGGVNAEQSFTMADSFIRQIEELSSIPEVEMLKREAKIAYACRVMTERENKNPKNKEIKNPLVSGVKDYIYSHLHSTIHVTDIAQHLHVNPDYLSHLFSVQEKKTITGYILEKKIHRSMNLLKYSDYSIREIAFYLGFSSQSHFTKIFQKINGMSPGKYRKQFYNWESWKST